MRKIIQLTIMLLFCSITITGQTKETKVADTHFNNLSYIKAAKAYKELAKSNPSKRILKRLGDSYYENVLMQDASEAYAQLFENYNVLDTEYMFKYAQSLRAIGNFEDSNVWMRKFNKANKADTRGKNFTKNIKKLKNIKDGKPLYKVTNLKIINTEFSDFGVTEFNNTILFASPKKVSKFIKRSHTRNDRNFLDIYQVGTDKITAFLEKPVSNSTNDSVKISRKDSIKNLKKEKEATRNLKEYFSKEINLKYHESSVSFSPDKKTMYFTRNNFNKGDYNVDEKGYNKLKIYRAEWIANKWSKITELPFCSNQYSVGHPSVSRNGKKLYFASDMPGFVGETDIFYVDINSDGTFGEVINLGPNINTEGREMFPYISEDDVLYFSSDGHFGIGALDVFASSQKKGVFSKPRNLGAPVNTKRDDFSFSINPVTKKGYLSSNREGGLGDDDIYSVVEIAKAKPLPPPPPPKPACMQVVSGVVRDKQFKKPLPGARLILKTVEGVVLKDIVVGNLADFTFTLPCNKKFVAYASKEYYKPASASFVTTDAVKVDLDLGFALEIVDEFSYNSLNDLVVKINPIYFDYNKGNIRADAALELDNVYAVMKKFPKIIVRGSSHTDARGKASYNEALSVRRANSTVEYIIAKGISPSRIFAKGFGETRLTNNCVDNDRHTNRVKCSKEEHQLNRRTEFVVTKL